MELSSPKIKRFLIFSQQLFSYISGNDLFKRTSYIPPREFSELENKKKIIQKNI